MNKQQNINNVKKTTNYKTLEKLIIKQSSINFFNLPLLLKFVSNNGLIISRTRLNFHVKKNIYKKIIKSIKTARILYLFPFIVK
jgi:ribosomal protein S18